MLMCLKPAGGCCSVLHSTHGNVPQDKLAFPHAAEESIILFPEIAVQQEMPYRNDRVYYVSVD